MCQAISDATDRKTMVGNAPRVSNGGTSGVSVRVRINNPGIARGESITLMVDGVAVPAFSGESLAVVLLELHGPRYLYCNMGVCGQCTVEVVAADGIAQAVRSCMTPVRQGMQVSTSRGLRAGA